MIIALQEKAGLGIALDSQTYAIKWSEGISAGETKPRTFAEMKEYIREPAARPTRDPLYFMHRDVAHSKDRDEIRARHLRYDITVIPPGCFVGERREFMRTAGHYHSLKPGTKATYPEVYEVISGRAYWLLQRPYAAGPERLEEIYAIEGGPGEKALILPGFGHLTINVSNIPLVLANWIDARCASDYGPYRRLRGGGYWLLEGSSPATVEFEKNANYASVAELKKLRPKEITEWELIESQPLYSLVDRITKLGFLNSPENYADILTLEKCYRPA